MPKEITVPEDAKKSAITLIDNQGKSYPGFAWIKDWSPQERRSRARKKTFKIVGTILAGSLIGLFVHILLIIIVPAVFITLVGAAPLYSRFLKEESTFFQVEAPCPSCQAEGPLRPYLNSRVSEKMTAQCPSCGATTSFHLS